jgi:hypothetical protein
MKTSTRLFGLGAPLACLAATIPAFGKDIVIRHADRASPRIVLVADKGKDAPREMETVAFLGVETSSVPRTVAKHLGLARDTGLIVNHVAKDSAAAAALQEDDILLKFEDQILIDSRQLSVLIRSKKEGDEVKLTFMRAGKEQTAKVKLGKKEVPKYGNTFEFFTAPGGTWNFQGPLIPPRAIDQGVAAGTARLKELTEEARDHAQDMIRRLQRERSTWFGTPGVRVITRGGKGSTILDLPRGNITYSDDDGSIEVVAEENKRQLTVKDKDGKTTFEGPITTEEERKKLPDDVRKRIEKIEFSAFSFEPGEAFEVEQGTLAPAGKTKIKSESPARRGKSGTL